MPNERKPRPDRGERGTEAGRQAEAGSKGGEVSSGAPQERGRATGRPEDAVPNTHPDGPGVGGD